MLLLAHIPSGTTDSLPSYGEVILDVTRRYKSIIVGILSAHTHTDGFELVRSVDFSVPLFYDTIIIIIIDSRSRWSARCFSDISISDYFQSHKPIIQSISHGQNHLPVTRL